MSDRWFTNKCMALVGNNGRALSGKALEQAEAAVRKIKDANCKLWTDRNGCFYYKEKRLFAPAYPLYDADGNQVRICGRMVKTKAKFCSKCGSSAPGSFWRCGGCGKSIGSESKTCPHCGRAQNPMIRLDISDGSWCKEDEVFAERFELADIAPLMTKGLNIQSNQCAILLSGGEVVDVLEAGFYRPAEMVDDESGDKSLIMVDYAEFSLPVCVEKLRTSDDIEVDLHTVLVLRFDPENAGEFMCNLMGSSLYLQSEALTTAIGYDEIAHCLLADVDAAAREFCNTCDVASLFKDAETRLRLEDYVAGRLCRNLSSVGMKFIRLKELEFESPVFDHLRAMSGEVEAKRKEIEFIRRADELANDATRREAMSEHEMEEYMDQLAHEKNISDELRTQEIVRLKTQWNYRMESEELSHENDLDDIQQKRQRERDRIDAHFNQEMLDLEHAKNLERRIAEQKSSLEYMRIETQIQDIKLEMAQKKVAAEQEAARKWLILKQEKQTFNQNQKIEMAKAADTLEIKALLAAESDPDKRRDLLALYEMQMQEKMSPELLLAAAAARGNAAAAEALSRMNQEQLAVIERSKDENRQLFEQMLQMNERIFNQAAESMAKAASAVSSTTQVIK